MIACVAECEKMYNNIITFISRFPVKPQVMLMKTSLKSNDKSNEQFLELERRTIGRGGGNQADLNNQTDTVTLTCVSRASLPGIPEQCT